MRYFLIFILLFFSIFVYTCHWRWEREFIQDEPSAAVLIGLWEAVPFSEYEKEMYDVSGQMRFRLNEDRTISDIHFYYELPGDRVSKIMGGGTWSWYNANRGDGSKKVRARWNVLLRFDNEKISDSLTLKRINGEMVLYYELIFDSMSVLFFRKAE